MENYEGKILVVAPNTKTFESYVQSLFDDDPDRYVEIFATSFRVVGARPDEVHFLCGRWDYPSQTVLWWENTVRLHYDTKIVFLADDGVWYSKWTVFPTRLK